MNESGYAKLRELPAVHKVMTFPEVQKWLEEYGHEDVVTAISSAIESMREQIILGEPLLYTDELLLEMVYTELRKRVTPHLRRVINATGTVLHTNLGRAPLAIEAIDAMVSVAKGYSNLEYDLATGKRGQRFDHVEELICELVGSEAAFIVNNNASAVFLMLSECAKGKKVAISRGELVEIGGSFRVSEVMRASGAELVEVGTTNKTHIRDYIKAIEEGADLVLRVHTSNFRIVGFTHQPSIQELVELAHQRQIPILEDLGSGSLIDLRNFGIGDEPTIRASLQAGVDVVTFSGDKLLGGAQAGFLCGKKAFIDRLKSNQLARAVRVDKMTLAAIEATLRLYRDEARAKEKIPALRMLFLPVDVLKGRAEQLVRELTISIGEFARCEVLETTSKVGGGALPLVEMATYAVTVSPFTISKEAVLTALRTAEPPVIARVADDQLIFDMRTLMPGDETDLHAAISIVMKDLSKSERQNIKSGEQGLEHQ